MRLDGVQEALEAAFVSEVQGRSHRHPNTRARHRSTGQRGSQVHAGRATHRDGAGRPRGGARLGRRRTGRSGSTGCNGGCVYRRTHTDALCNPARRFGQRAKRAPEHHMLVVDVRLRLAGADLLPHQPGAFMHPEHRAAAWCIGVGRVRVAADGVLQVSCLHHTAAGQQRYSRHGGRRVARRIPLQLHHH
ncbi:hypothetical protein D9M68_204960 [compost metagenome]